VGALDITFYRDDLIRLVLPFLRYSLDLTGKTVLLVDDVIYKGGRFEPRWIQ